MRITEYTDDYKKQVIELILHIQNDEAGINLSIDEQPDLTDIDSCYSKNGGKFWLAVENNELIGTIALMNMGNGHGVLKKFFVRGDYRGKKIGLALYKKLYEFAVENHFACILLDTPSVALASHRFYERAGFKKIVPARLPFEYEYPDRDSYLYLLDLRNADSGQSQPL